MWSLWCISYEGAGMKTFTKQEVIQEMIDQLMDLADGFEVPVDEDGDCSGGVCMVTDDLMCNLLWEEFFTHMEVENYIDTLINSWPHHCGSKAFPIAGEDEYRPLDTSPSNGYSDLWTDEHEVDRRDLCEWIADGLKELL